MVKNNTRVRKENEFENRLIRNLIAYTLIALVVLLFNIARWYLESNNYDNLFDVYICQVFIFFIFGFGFVIVSTIAYEFR
jgi:uncharacterized oligopeptide transporter (OPT) family protein